MPVNPVVFSTVEVRAHYLLPGAEEAINVFNAEAPVGDLTQALAEDYKDAFVTAWTTNLQSLVSDNVTLDQVVVTDLRATDGPSFEFPLAEVGGNAVDSLPNQCAALIKWTTAKRGRSSQGRSYIAGFCEDQSNGVNWTAPLVTALDDFAADLLTAMQALGDGLYIVSRYTAGAPRAVNQTETVLNGKASTIIRTMRTRAKY